jgi:hypothetical protein
MKKIKGRNGTSHKTEQRRNQRESLVQRLKQLIEEQRHGDITRVCDKVDDVAIDNKLATKQKLTQNRRQKIEQVNYTGGPAPGTGRSLCGSAGGPDPTHHLRDGLIVAKVADRAEARSALLSQPSKSTHGRWASNAANSRVAIAIVI